MSDLRLNWVKQRLKELLDITDDAVFNEFLERNEGKYKGELLRYLSQSLDGSEIALLFYKAGREEEERVEVDITEEELAESRTSLAPVALDVSASLLSAEGSDVSGATSTGEGKGKKGKSKKGKSKKKAEEEKRAAEEAAAKAAAEAELAQQQEEEEEEGAPKKKIITRKVRAVCTLCKPCSHSLFYVRLTACQLLYLYKMKRKFLVKGKVRLCVVIFWRYCKSISQKV